MNPSRHSGSIPRHQDQRRPANTPLEYAPQDQTITTENYIDVLRRLRDAKDRSCGQQSPPTRQCSSTFLVLDYYYFFFFAKNTLLWFHKTPYFPDMAPCNFWLYLKFKRSLKRKRFQTRESIMTATTAELNTIPKEAFSHCFQQWRWEKCVESQGDY
ncbi:hypothetical protein LAZ67_X000043 [Cordylochernes scorpioides]|uniref:Uncharacterized protein n=1 Tax=Cordylochernes scorpioides TaxID=51811 RepID=A0ABY6LTW5_9ARAC|nr:hypothetical protein LAZ67_X000043 [Cordylochernes scorpioides]